jgi:hypothetical protein
MRPGGGAAARLRNADPGRPLIITRDSMISQNRNELTAVRENKAKMAPLNQRDAQTKWASSRYS